MKKAALLFAAALSLSARPAPQVKADGAEAYRHIPYLASDEIRGRKAGTPEYAKAAEYVAAKMKECGLQPGGDNGAWFQEVPFKSWSNFDLPIRLEIASPERRVYFAGRGRDFQPARGTGSGVARGAAAFVGYGVVSEKPAWDDYAGLDVKGRIVVFLPGSPPVIDGPAAEALDAREEGQAGRRKGRRRGHRDGYRGARPAGRAAGWGR